MVYRAVYKRGQFAGSMSAPLDAGRQGVPSLCASTEPAAPSAELSAQLPGSWESPVPWRLQPW